jgi:hypothetical protein
MANKKRDEPVIRVTVGLDQSDHDQLSRIAESAGVSLAWMMRRAAREFIERVDTNMKDPLVLGTIQRKNKRS